VDVMDNHFVPSLTFGPQMVKRLVEVSPIPLDVHLMVENADDNAVVYADLGAQSVTFHIEAATSPRASSMAFTTGGQGMRMASSRDATFALS